LSVRERWIVLGLLGWASLGQARSGDAAAEVRLGRDFLDGIVAKLPPCKFDKADQYHGSVHSYRLVAIDPGARSILISCQVEGQFRPPVKGPISERVGRSPQTTEGWRAFRFDVKAHVNVEPGPNSLPRFRIQIDEVKRKELDGLSGVVAKFLGKYFDEIVTQIASGRAIRLNERLNSEIAKHVMLFNEYGVFRGIDYTLAEIVLHFDLTRYRSEGITGYVFAEAQAGAVPFHRWLHPRDGSHFYTTAPAAPDRPNAVSEGVACYVFDHSIAETVPLYRWHRPRDDLYTRARDGKNSDRAGYRPAGIACYIYAEPKPGTVALYRFYDPIRHHHFYSTHPHAECKRTVLPAPRGGSKPAAGSGYPAASAGWKSDGHSRA
jgi:hypothetical protein